MKSAHSQHNSELQSDVSLKKDDAISDTESTVIVNDILNVILKKDISDSNFLKNEVDPGLFHHVFIHYFVSATAP